jgi:hypothetical protein
VIASCEGGIIDLPLDLEKLTRVEFIRPDDYPQKITVSLAGTTGANGLYLLEDGSSRDIRPTYKSGDYLISWDGSKWIIEDATQTLYQSTDDVVSPSLVTPWTAVDGTLPVPAVENSDNCENTIAMKPIPFDQRDELLRDTDSTGKLKGCYQYAIDKRASSITFYPRPREDYDFGPESIRITWEGVKTDYDGADEVPFGPDTIKNCADYLNANLARKKEDKLARYNSFYQSFLEGRREIHQAQKEKSWQRA